LIEKFLLISTRLTTDNYKRSYWSTTLDMVWTMLTPGKCQSWVTSRSSLLKMKST